MGDTWQRAGKLLTKQYTVSLPLKCGQTLSMRGDVHRKYVVIRIGDTEAKLGYLEWEALRQMCYEFGIEEPSPEEQAVTELTED